MSGDVELNPGPGTLKEILQTYSAKLSKAISADVNNVTSALFSNKLLPQGTKDYVVTAVGVSASEKADRVINDVMGQLDGSLDQRQYLADVCNVLTQQGESVKQIGNAMLKKLDLGSIFDFSDFYEILDALRRSGFSMTNKWLRLGLILGLSINTLDIIGANYKESEGRLERCLELWLKRYDDVDAKGGPTMASLCGALESIGDRAAADHIKHTIIKKKVSIHVETSENHQTSENENQTSEDQKQAAKDQNQIAEKQNQLPGYSTDSNQLRLMEESHDVQILLNHKTQEKAAQKSKKENYQRIFIIFLVIILIMFIMAYLYSDIRNKALGAILFILSFLVLVLITYLLYHFYQTSRHYGPR